MVKFLVTFVMYITAQEMSIAHYKSFAYVLRYKPISKSKEIEQNQRIGTPCFEDQKNQLLTGKIILHKWKTLAIGQ